jgi:hypothetical protein
VNNQELLILVYARYELTRAQSGRYKPWNIFLYIIWQKPDFIFAAEEDRPRREEILFLGIESRFFGS